MLWPLKLKKKKNESFFITEPTDFDHYLIPSNLGLPDQKCQLLDLQFAGNMKDLLFPKENIRVIIWS